MNVAFRVDTKCFMTKNELRRRMSEHDHYYFWSDDQDVWRAGAEDVRLLLSELMHLPLNEAVKIIKETVPQDLQQIWFIKLAYDGN